MPDMSPTDLAAIAGAFLAAVISGLGLRHGAAERRGLPFRGRTPPGEGDERAALQSVLDALHAIHADLSAWRRQDETERRADRDRSTRERFEQIETDQARILDLLRGPDGDAPGPSRPR